jgi:hypothetical protein
MYSVEADSTRRFLVISVAGKVAAAEARETGERVRDLLRTIEPGFVALTDFRWLQSMETGAAPFIGEIMDQLSAAKVSAVVRVVPDPHKDIGLNILSKFHYRSDTRVATFETLADAVQSLAGQ